MTIPQYERCWDEHEQTGTLGWPSRWPDQPVPGRQFSTAVCDRPKCRASANRAVRKATGHDGVFVSFEQARMEYRAADLAAFYYPDDPGQQALLEASHV